MVSRIVWKSSTLNTYEGPEHCLICQFIDAFPAHTGQQAVAVIKQLDSTLADEEALIKYLQKVIVVQSTRITELENEQREKLAFLENQLERMKDASRTNDSDAE